MTLVFSPIYVSKGTLLGGSVAFNIKIPGTFANILPTDPTAGRWFQEAEIWSDSAISGDTVTDMKLTDTDGVVPSEQRFLFPNYPDIIQFYDTSVTGASGPGLLIPPSRSLVIRPFEIDSKPVIKFLPSQLYLTGTLTSGDLSLGKVFRINIIWARSVAF